MRQLNKPVANGLLARLFFTVSAGLGFTVLGGQLSIIPASAEEFPEIGFIGPLTGDLANYGSDAKHAIELALEDLNSSGQSLKISYQDGKCQGKDSSAAAKLLAEVEHVPLIIAGGCSSEVLGAAPVAQRAHIVLLSSYGESSAISSAGEYVFRISPNAAAAGSKAAELLHADGRKAIAIIAENSDYPLNFRDNMTVKLKQFGIEPIADETYLTSDSDFRTVLLRILANKPDAILVDPQSGLKAGLVVKQLRQLNPSIPLYGNFAFSSADALNSGGAADLEGLKFIDAPVVGTERGAKFIERFSTRFGKPQSDFHVAATYDTVMLAARALADGAKTGEQIKNYFDKMPEFEGIGFNYRFDSNGDVIGVNYVVKIITRGQVSILGSN